MKNQNRIQEMAEDFIGASLEKPRPGETIDREQLGEQLRAAGDTISDAEVEAVAQEIERLSNMTKYKIEGLDSSGQWDESLVGNDSEANTFDTEDEARAMIPELVRAFRDNEKPPTEHDFRVAERK